MSVLLIDGRSGSGKTVLAEKLAREAGAQVLHLDDLYPGWQGLSAGSAAVAAVLTRGSFTAYDWHAQALRGEEVLLDPARPLIVEGCGAITRANLAAAREWLVRSSRAKDCVFSIWVEAPESLRRRRALERDGATFVPHWESWAAQEDRHFGAHRPWQLADEVRTVAGETA